VFDFLRLVEKSWWELVEKKLVENGERPLPDMTKSLENPIT
jgi:hypothetical protein